MFQLETDHVEKILDHCGITYKTYNNRISMSCPIHGSDKSESLSISLNEQTKFIWKCWSNHCEEEIITVGNTTKKRGKYVLSLISELLKIKYNKDFNYWDTLKWCSKFLNVGIDIQNSDNTDYIKIGKIISKDRVTSTSSITRSFIRSNLKIPAKYFIDRGFNPDILDRYDVGYCNTPNKEMYTRAVVPIYDDNYKFMVGCVGRSINQQCKKCGKFHYEKKLCPTNNIEERWSEKWLNSSKFSSANYLYNYWFAKELVNKTSTAILVEGQGDVWKMVEAGYNNVLGLFGSSLTEQQKIALDKLGALNLIIATDNDAPGLKARETIKLQCERYYNIWFVDLVDTKDIGDMSTELIKRTFDPILGKI